MTTVQLSEAEQKMIERIRARKQKAMDERAKKRAEKAQKDADQIIAAWIDDGGPRLSIQARKFICEAETKDGKDAALHILDAKGRPLFTIGAKRNKDGTYARPAVKPATKAPAKKAS